jgi:hypothetical protein
VSKASIPPKLRRETIRDFEGRYAYCRSPEALVQVFYEVDHIIPEARGGLTVLENLAFACPICNRFKTAQTHGRDSLTHRRVALFHPRRQNWFRHFAWSSDGLTIYGRTVCGRATVEALRLNNERLVVLRELWLQLNALPPNWERDTRTSALEQEP